MTSETTWQRSDLLGTQVITRNNGKRLGVVSQLWVDIDRREVVALGLRENIFSGIVSGTQEIMLLRNIRQIGDVILVDDDNVLEDNLDVESYSSVINSEVITETGELLGKVRGFKFNVETGQLESLIVASLGLPLIPDQIVSTYELSIEEVVSSGPDRLIVFEGAEDKLVQLTVGVLERLGIGRPPWEREDDDYYVMPTSAANQLGTGLPTTQPLRTAAAPARDTWDEDNWGEAESRAMQEPMQELEPEPYYEEDNWGNTEEPRQQVAYVEDDYRQSQYVEEDVEVTGDAWADDENPKPYQAPKLNLPERQKVAEYEEEVDY
jgi:sporulation protein YlmC with PRC-barrel domain